MHRPLLTFPAPAVLRHRHVAPTHLAPEIEVPKEVTTIKTWGTAIAFSVSILLYCATGLLCLLLPVQPTVQATNQTIPTDAVCLRATRHADYVAVDLPLGSPFLVYSLLLRLDHVVERSEAVSNVRLRSTRVVESSTVDCAECDGCNTCTDLAVLQLGGPSSSTERALVTFQYMNPTSSVAFNTFPNPGSLGLDGELFLSYGAEYFLTATHFCSVEGASTTPEETAQSQAEPTEDRDGAVVLTLYRPDNASAAQLTTTSLGLQLSSSTLRSTPVATECGSTEEVTLFPAEAAEETRWLGLSSTRAYEQSPTGVEERRIVVEIGTTCAVASTQFASAYALYSLDCKSEYTPCTTFATVPFRRVANDSLRLWIPPTVESDAFLWTHTDPRLDTLPRLEDPTHALWQSIAKLALMMLAAAVVWIRAAKDVSSQSQLFLHCLRKVNGMPHRVSDGWWQDGVIGLTAIVARGGVLWWRYDTLLEDGNLRLWVTQVISVVLALIHFSLRYFAFQGKVVSPLTRLGGSTALVDASCSVMLGFCEAPLLVNSMGRFDPTARLLTSLLLTIVTMQRCAFASACCALLLFNSDVDMVVYHGLLVGSLLMWWFQIASVGILLADAFATPLAFSVLRATPGGSGVVSILLFLAITVASLPQLLAQATEISKTPIRQPDAEGEEEKST
jgi:hypothetical protein